MDQEWQVIPIEDVRPGDVARCNGLEWQVVETIWPCGWLVQAENRSSYAPIQCKELGFKFWRKVKPEPRTFRGTVTGYGPRLQSVIVTLDPMGALPLMGSEVEITELLGEDGS